MSKLVKRAVAVIGASVSLTVAMSVPGVVTAHAETIDELTITIATPDLEYGSPDCMTSLTMRWKFDPGSDLGETAEVRILSTGCGPVHWTPSVSVHDWAPNRPAYGVAMSGGGGNPAGGAVSQTVAYGIGIREVARITMQYAGRSRLGEICYHQRSEYDAATWVVKTLQAAPCAPEWLSS